MIFQVRRKGGDIWFTLARATVLALTASGAAARQLVADAQVRAVLSRVE